LWSVAPLIGGAVLLLIGIRDRNLWLRVLLIGIRAVLRLLVLLVGLCARVLCGSAVHIRTLLRPRQRVGLAGRRLIDRRLHGPVAKILRVAEQCRVF